MRVQRFAHVNLNGHAGGCCCDCCAVIAPMDPSSPPQPLLMMNAGVQTVAATDAQVSTSVYDRSATLGDLATLIGVLSALFYIFRGR